MSRNRLSGWFSGRTSAVSLITLGLVVALSVASVIVSHHGLQESRRLHREATLQRLHSDIRFNVNDALRYVYGCNAGTPHDVPCPDYTATVEFRGDDPATRPLVNPARDAQGRELLGFDVVWMDEVGRWRVTPVPAPRSLIFAANEYYDEQWMGPVFVSKAQPLYSYTGKAGERVEFYVADGDAGMVGAPLSQNRLG